MAISAYFLVGLGGAIGSMARYGVGRLVSMVVPTPFPVATLLVNVTGSFAMGILVALLANFTFEWDAEARLFVATGILGGFTTFSTFSLDTIGLIQRGEAGLALVYVVLSIIVSVCALALGLWLVRGGFS